MICRARKSNGLLTDPMTRDVTPRLGGAIWVRENHWKWRATDRGGTALHREPEKRVQVVAGSNPGGLTRLTPGVPCRRTTIACFSALRRYRYRSSCTSCNGTRFIVHCLSLSANSPRRASVRSPGDGRIRLGCRRRVARPRFSTETGVARCSAPRLMYVLPTGTGSWAPAASAFGTG